jgi:hypothetical protein
MRLLVAIALVGSGCASDVTRGEQGLESPLGGAILATTADGVDATIFTAKDAVYLAGGPRKADDAALPRGNYVFEVTDRAGTVLSLDPVSCRGFHVDETGRISGTYDLPCARPVAEDTIDGGLTLRLVPYADADDGQYEVHITGAQTYADLDAFVPEYSRTDTFEVCAGPTGCRH